MHELIILSATRTPTFSQSSIIEPEMEKPPSRPQLKKRVVLVPYHHQGHITPMLQLGSILDSHGFSVTIAHTIFNSPDPSDHPRLNFLPLSDGLDGYDTYFYNVLKAISVMNANCEGPFEEQMIGMLEEEDDYGEVACIVYDTIMEFVDAVASKLKVPSIVLRTNSAAFIYSHVVLFQLLKDNLIPLPESEMLLPIPEMQALRFKDLPMPATQQIPKPVMHFLHSYISIKSSSAVIWNTAESLDRGPLQQLRHHHSSVPIFPVGPLHKTAQPSPTSLLEEDNTCLSWLDNQSPNSVLFISLGSLAIIDEEELFRMASGIAKSQQPFLWVLRPSLLGGSGSGSDPIKTLPEDFPEVTRERGCIVKWAPQKKVLAHVAVGGFLTHCGWNSTLESLCEGVPVICRPCFADQMMNARYLTHVWRVGVEVEMTSEGGYETAIRRLMGSEEGRMMRERVMELKEELEESVNGGASGEAVGRLVEFITSPAAARK